MNFINLIPHDKQGHFIAGVLCYLAFHFVNILVAFVVVFIMAVGKEVYDYLHRDKHTPDVWDAVATMLGGLCGYLCGFNF